MAPHGQIMAASISATLIPCLKSFNQIQRTVEQSDYKYEDNVSSVSWTDELGRLRVWAANIGAHQTGQSSLDFRLRDASHISQHITNLLKDLDGILKDIKRELSGDHVEASGIVASSDDEDAWPDGEGSTSEIQQLYEEAVNVVDCLYKMSMLIRRPAQHDVLLGSHKGDAAAFEPFDKEHVRNKFPNADNVTIQRLGRAITQRRKYLKYRDRHHAKLGKGIDGIQCNQGAQGTAISSLSETIATEFENLNIDFEDTSANSGVSQTSYAPSLTDGGSITIPPPPKESAAGMHFECPYCFFLIEINGKRSWTRHIFRDIKPYVCMLSDCTTPDRLFESRREWFSHVTTKHHVNDLTCPLCKDTLTSLRQFERHVARHLEELALFALPRSEMDDESDEDGLDARASSNGSHVGLGSANSWSSDKGRLINEPFDIPHHVEGERDDIADDHFERLSRYYASNAKRLEKLVYANIKPSGDPVSGEVIREMHELSMRGKRTAYVLLAALGGTATLEQSAELDACIPQKHRNDFHAGVSPFSAPDVLHLSHRGKTFPLYFSACGIFEGRLQVGEVRRRAALETLTNHLGQIRLIYKGKLLNDDSRACKDENIKPNSRIELLITEIGKGEDGQAEGAAQTEDQAQRKGRDEARDLV